MLFYYLMTSKSWLVTLTPLIIAVLTTLKAAVYGTDLTDNEIELIKYSISAFIGSGAIGAFLKVKKP